MSKNNSTKDIIKMAKMFEFYVNHIWPAHRFFVKNKLSKRCTKCAASEKMIPLQENGLCVKCNEYKNAEAICSKKFDIQLTEILQFYQGQGKKGYDALVLFSGGKDSAYLIRRLQLEYPKLRILAFTLDNGYMSPIAQANVQEMVPKLKVDHFFYHPPEDFHKKLFRYAITHLNEQGGYGTVDFSDGEFLLDTARNIAYEKEIPLILCGYSRYQVQNGLKLNHFESPAEIEYTNRTHTAGLAIKDLPLTESERQLWWHGEQKVQTRIARLLFPLYAWDLEEDFIKSEVIRYGLIQEKNHSPIVTNHLLIPLLGVVDVHQLGYSSFEIEFCRMIREGKARLKDWLYVFEFLEYASKTGLFVKPAVSQGLSLLDLTLKDVGVQYA